MFKTISTDDLVTATGGFNWPAPQQQQQGGLRPDLPGSASGNGPTIFNPQLPFPSPFPRPQPSPSPWPRPQPVIS